MALPQVAQEETGTHPSSMTTGRDGRCGTTRAAKNAQYASPKRSP
jgi:hypothetical protein